MNGPIYPDWRGVRPSAEFADNAPTKEVFVEYFKSDHHSEEREQLATWAAGKPGPSLIRTLGGRNDRPAYCLYGRLFGIQRVMLACASLLSDAEAAQVALGDIEPTAVPRYRHRSYKDVWVYMDPQRNFRSTPLAASR